LIAICARSGAVVVDSEVRPPQSGGEREPEERRASDGRIEHETARPDACRHDGFTECDQQQEIVALDEMRRPKIESGWPAALEETEQQLGAELEDDRGDP
jgi:hypothetical protein